MSTPADRPLDALGLARSGATVEREFPTAGFARLRDQLAGPEGRVLARAEFGRAGRWPAARLSVDAEVMLTCQRCLGPMLRRLHSDAQLVFAEAGAADLPEGHEPVDGDPRQLDLAALVEDELLLSLPLIPQHDAAEDCALPDAATAAGVELGATESRRPFAGLKDLLKH